MQLDQDQDGGGITAGVGNVNTFSTATNASTFIRDIQIECNGITVYNNTRANESSNELSLLKYTKEYTESVAKDNFFYIDTSTGTAEARTGKPLYNKGFGTRKSLTDAGAENKISYTLNIHTYFAAFKNNLHPNIKMNILIRLKNDNNIVFRTTQAPNSKVLITKFRLWCPKIMFNGTGMKQYLENFLKPKIWVYLRKHQEIDQTAAVGSFFRVSKGIRRPRHVFLWVVRTTSYNNQERNIFTFKTFSIGANNRHFSKAQLEINNSIYYPQLELSSNEESRLYRALMSYNSAYNDFLSGSLIEVFSHLVTWSEMGKQRSNMASASEVCDSSTIS